MTGGASGMGAATARKLATQGAAVFIVDQNEELATAVSDDTGMPSPLIGDVSDSGFCDQAIQAAKSHSGRVDILVNCAGIYIAC